MHPAADLNTGSKAGNQSQRQIATQAVKSKTKKLLLALTLTLSLLLALPLRVAAQNVLSAVQVENLPGGHDLTMYLDKDIKSASHKVTVNQNGPVTAFEPPPTRVELVPWVCVDADGNIKMYLLLPGAPNPCPDGKRLAAIYFGGGNGFTLDATPGHVSVTQTSVNTPASSAAGGHESKFEYTPRFELRGFGGASFIHGNTAGTAGFDGAVLFPLGNRIFVGPSAGFQWVDNSIVNRIGSMTPGSTFINTSVGFKQGNFGGQIGLNLGGWRVGVPVGATVAGASITQAEGFCGLGNATSPAGCMVTSKTSMHDTVVGPFVGGYISHTIISDVDVFAGYNYHFGLKETQPNVTNPTGPRTTVFDVHYGEVSAGFVFHFGRH